MSNPYEALKLFYQSAGDSADPAVLLIHGLGADHQMWEAQINSFADVGFYVLAPDMRSHGQSETRDFSISACTMDLIALLDDLRIDKTHLVGVSMGGLVAQQMACDFPQRVDKVVICDSFSGVTTISEKINAWVGATSLAVLPNSLLTKILVTTYQRMGHAEAADYFAERLAAADTANLRAARKAVNAFDIIARLPEIQAPTLVLVGDGFGKTAVEMARKTAQGIRRADFQILAGGGDPSHLLVPEAFNQQVLAFLNV